MGIEINRDHFDPTDHELFAGRLREQLAALRELLAKPGFGAGATTIGAELEVNLVDRDMRPFFANAEVLAEACDPRLTLEIDRFNLEVRSRPVLLRGSSFHTLETELEDAIMNARRAAKHLGGRIVTVGILPTLEARDFGPNALSECHRYRALSNRLRELRRGLPFDVHIEGDDSLSFAADDVTLEGANTSFQIHLRVAPDAFVRTYNAAQLATGAALAVGANSPTLFGKRLWDETRVALFRQSIDDRARDFEDDWRPARVSFGHGWVRRSAIELFEEIVALHTTLLPVLTDEDAVARVRAREIPRLAELRLHAGTVWRWNRPVFDDAFDGHLRIELRALPAGPTVVDALATGALLLGLTLGLSRTSDRWIDWLTFGQARRNFYQAARFGLQAELLWPREASQPQSIRACDLVPRLIPLARAGLVEAGVDTADVDRLLGIVEDRIASGRTGAAWQRAALDRLHGASNASSRMLGLYANLSESRQPVHSWPLP